MLDEMAKGVFRRSTSLPANYILPTTADCLLRRRNGLAYIFCDQPPLDVELILEQLKFTRTTSFCAPINTTVYTPQTKLGFLSELQSYVNDELSADSINYIDNDTDELEAPSQDMDDSCTDGSDQHRCQFYISDCSCPIPSTPASSAVTTTPESSPSPSVLSSDTRQQIPVAMTQSDFDSELDSRVTGKIHQAELPGYCRRNALADIFSGIPHDDTVEFLAIYSQPSMGDDITAQDLIPTRGRRRHAVADIFSGLSEEDRDKLILIQRASNSCTMMQNGDVNLSRSRRSGMANIFDGIIDDDRDRLRDLAEVLHSDEEIEMMTSHRRLARRHARGDIFSDMPEDDLSRLRLECHQ